jgi:preprotein translocase subunit SecD
MGGVRMNFSFRETLCCLFCCAICVPDGFARLQATSSQNRVEFRLAEITPGPGLSEARVDSPLQMIYLHRDAIITGRDIVEARALEEPNVFGQYEVILVFTREAAKRMALATETYRGLVAILIDGKVVLAVGIPTRIQDRATISVPKGKQEAENLAATLSKGSRSRR